MKEITFKKNIRSDGYCGCGDYDFSFIKEGSQILDFSRISTGDFFFMLAAKDDLNKNFLIPKNSEFFEIFKTVLNKKIFFFEEERKRIKKEYNVDLTDKELSDHMNTGFSITGKIINYVDRNFSHNDGENGNQRSMTIFEGENGINLTFNILNRGIEIVGSGRSDESPFYYAFCDLVALLNKKSEQTPDKLPNNTRRRH